MAGGKFQVVFKGQVIGKRSSLSKDYTHAVVVRKSEDHARAASYGYKATKSDKSNFEFYSERAAQTPGVPYMVNVTGHGPSWSYQQTLTAEQHAEAVAKVEGGYEAFVERERQKLIAKFEEAKAKGVYDTYEAVAYSSRLDLADKAAGPYRNNPLWSEVHVVEVQRLPDTAKKQKVA